MFRPLVLVTAAVTAVSGVLVVAPEAAHAAPAPAMARPAVAHPAVAGSGVVVLAPQRVGSVGAEMMASLLGSAPTTSSGVFVVPMAVPNPLTGLGVYDNESLTPKLSAVASDPDGGTVTTKFFARYVGDSSWTIMNAVAVSGASGSRVYAQVPSAKLSAGQAFQWAAQACDATSCSALSAVQTGYASPAVGAGQVPGGTFLDRPLSDTVSVKVNVGTGNLLVRTTGLSMPGIGTDLTLGSAFNSLNLAAGSRYPSGSTGRGWRLSTGPDQSVVANATGSLSYFGTDGLVDLFRPSGASYISVNGQKHVLDKMTGADPNIPGSPVSAYRITENSTGTRLYFNSTGHLIAAYDRHQQKTGYTYDASNHLTSITSTRGGAGANTATVTPWAPSPALIGTLTQTTATGPATSRTLGYGYDTSGHLSTITDAAGQVTTFGYTVDDLTSITTPAGQVTTFTFDSRHRVTSMTQKNSSSPGDSLTRLDYTDGTHTNVADPNTDPAVAPSTGPHAAYWLTNASGVLDRMGRVPRFLDATHTDLTHPTLTRTFTGFGDVATATDADGHSTTNAWSANGGQSLASSTAPGGAVASYAYANTNTTTNPTAAFQTSAATDPNGHASTYSYDVYGSVAFVTDASSNKAQVAYNTDGTIKSSTDPGNGANATTYTVTAATHQLATMTPVTGSSLRPRTLTWDGFGRIATATTGALSGGGEVTVSYAYDKAPTGGIGRLDRLASIDYSDSTPDVTYTYTGDGQVATRTVGTVTTTYTYTALDQVKTITTSSGGGTLSYGYDPAGNLTTLTDTRGTTTYSYDAANHLTSMADAFGHLTQFGLDANGRRTDTWFATNTANTAWTAHTHVDFDTSGRVSRTKTTRDSSDTATADIVSDLTYSYSAPGPSTCAGSPAAGTDTTTRWAVTDATIPTAPVTTRYCYDKSNRLTDANPLNGHHYAYGYDANGNTTTSTTDGTTTSYPANPANQVTATGYTYDGAGNLTAAPSQTFTYNGAGQTTSNNGSSADFASADQVERTHTYDGLDMIYGRAPTSGPTAGQAWLQSWTTTAGPAYLDRDPDGVPISLTFTGNTYYYVRDGLGTVTNLVSAQDQSVVATYTYTPYGGLVSGGAAGMGYTNRVRYAGGEYDRRTGYTHFGERFYDPATTKFTQQDRITKLANPQNGNAYQYAAADPINYVDPTGSHAWTDLIGLTLGVATGVACAIGTALAGTIACAVAGALFGQGVAYSLNFIVYGEEVAW